MVSVGRRAWLTQRSPRAASYFFSQLFHPQATTSPAQIMLPLSPLVENWTITTLNL